MDELVLKAMAKWPNVPDCYGWLGLDGRGNWYMRDAKAQAAGSFGSGLVSAMGSLLRHEQLIAFIERNYACDQRGCWYFQNGPQRVFVELAHTPVIWRLHPDFTLQDHCGKADTVMASFVDEAGHLYLQGARALGLVHSQDMTVAADAVEQALWRPQNVRRSDLPGMFGFVCSPQALADAPAPAQK